jgi:hypothetical protein
MKPTEKTPSGVVEAILMMGGFLPDLELGLKLGREIQNEWMNSYQDVQLTNTFKILLRRKLNLPNPT